MGRMITIGSLIFPSTILGKITEDSPISTSILVIAIITDFLKSSGKIATNKKSLKSYT